MTRHYEDTETRRRQVAEAALHTITEQGVAGFTTRAIAARVGISDGTLFRHFGNKQEIALEAMRLLEIEIEAGMITTGDPLEELEAFFRHRAAFVGAEGSVGRLIFSDGLVHLAGEAGRERIEHWRQISVAYMIRRLEQLAIAGRTRGGIAVPAMGMLIQGALLTFAMQASLSRAGSPAALQGRIELAWSTLNSLLFIAP